MHTVKEWSLSTAAAASDSSKRATWMATCSKHCKSVMQPNCLFAILPAMHVRWVQWVWFIGARGGLQKSWDHWDSWLKLSTPFLQLSPPFLTPYFAALSWLPPGPSAPLATPLVTVSQISKLELYLQTCHALSQFWSSDSSTKALFCTSL